MGYDSDTKDRQASGAAAVASRVTATWRGLPAFARWGSLLIAALLLYWLLSSLFFSSEDVTYRTAPATRGTIEQTVTALGSLQPKNYVDVGAQVSGQLKTVHVEVGDAVKQGDLLAEIDAKVYETEVAAARARLADLESQLAGAEAELVLARRQYARNLDLAKIDAVSRDVLAAGSVGFVIAGIKEIDAAKVGDTITLVNRPAAEPLPGFKEIKPQVFAGLYPV